MAEAYQIFLRSSAITSLVPFCYMFLVLARLDDVRWWQRVAGVVGFCVAGAGTLVAFVPPGGVEHVVVFELKLVAGALGPMAFGLWLYWRAQRARRGDEAAAHA